MMKAVPHLLPFLLLLVLVSGGQEAIVVSSSGEDFYERRGKKVKAAAVRASGAAAARTSGAAVAAAARVKKNVPFSLFSRFECNKQSQNLQLRQEEEDDEPPQQTARFSPKKTARFSPKGKKAARLLNNDDDPWVFPFPYLHAGILLTSPPGVSTTLPTTTQEASAQGWKFQGSSCKWINDDIDRFKLSFLDDSLVAVEVLGDPAPISDPDLYTKKGYEISFYDAAPTTSTTRRRAAVRTGQNFPAIVDHNNMKYPMDVAKATDNRGEKFYQGSCFPPMGGLHYYTRPFNEGFNPIVPIYDSAGTGEMTALIVGMGLVPEGTTTGFDGNGVALAGTFGCDFNFCNEPGCTEAVQELTNGSTEKEEGATSPVHLLFGVNPADPTTWKACGFTCMLGTCSCCGTEAEETAPRSCGVPPWPPIFPTSTSNAASPNVFELGK